MNIVKLPSAYLSIMTGRCSRECRARLMQL